MKALTCFAVILLNLSAGAQQYDAFNISLIAHLAPNNDTTKNVALYSGSWGWQQTSKNREYFISGASNGTYFVDVTNPQSPVVCDYVASHSSCTWREVKTYSHYCYIVSDVCTPNAFQIVDLQYLPDSVHVVHNSALLFERGHTVWIDGDKMYVGLVKFSGGSSAMAVYSLANPELPMLLRRIEQDSLNINEVHDMYVRNDTVYASAGWQGLHVLRFTPSNTFERLGNYSDYPFHGYNHSSYLTTNGKYLLFTDEVPESLPMKFVDVQNFGNIQPIKHWQPAGGTTPHNPYIIGDSIAIVSCYKDGLWVYNISDPNTISLSGYFDTYPQGGANTMDYSGGAYAGNWGAYPFFKSGVIVANDMQNGIFVLDPSAAYSTSIINPVGISENTLSKLHFYPNPAATEVRVAFRSAVACQLVITDLLGNRVYSKSYHAGFDEVVNTTDFAAGCYLVTVTSEHQTARGKLIVKHP